MDSREISKVHQKEETEIELRRLERNDKILNQLISEQEEIIFSGKLEEIQEALYSYTFLLILDFDLYSQLYSLGKQHKLTFRVLTGYSLKEAQEKLNRLMKAKEKVEKEGNWRVLKKAASGFLETSLWFNDTESSYKPNDYWETIVQQRLSLVPDKTPPYSSPNLDDLQERVTSLLRSDLATNNSSSYFKFPDKSE